MRRVWNDLLVCGVLSMTWNDFLVLGALACILAGAWLCAVDDDVADDVGLCRLLGVILLNAAALMVVIAWHNGTL